MSLPEFPLTTLAGAPASTTDYSDKVLLVVNVASKCGFTNQYKGLEEIYQRYHGRGFEIVGFPCNQFGSQEPGTAEDIQQFCSIGGSYPVSFPLMDKAEVNGDNAHPLYKWMKSEAPGILGTEAIKWNFTKFLIDRKGQVVKRYGSMDKPEDLAGEIEKLL